MKERKILQLSTAHLSEATVAYLASTDCMDWKSLGGPYGNVGWIFYVDQELACEDDAQVFADLYRAFRFAADHGYELLLFYDIAEPTEGLPVCRDFEDEDPITYQGTPERLAAQRRVRKSLTNAQATALNFATKEVVALRENLDRLHVYLNAIKPRLSGEVSNDDWRDWHQEANGLSVQLLGLRTLINDLAERLRDTRFRGDAGCFRAAKHRA